MTSRSKVEAEMLKASQEAKALTKAVKPIMKRAIAEGDGWRPSRAELYALVDACCDLGEASRARGSMATALRGYDPAARVARDVARALASGAFGWTEAPGPIRVAPTAAAEADDAWRRQPDRSLALWRMEVVERLRRSPTVLPAMMLHQLTTALESLNDGTGEFPSLLAPLPKEGRGRDPRAARGLEEQMWQWIYYQNGTGRRLSDAIADVAAAVDRSAGAVKAWRDQWRARAVTTFPYVPIEPRLQDWKEVGKQDAANDAQLKYEASEMRQLAKAWLDATLPAKAVSES